MSFKTISTTIFACLFSITIIAQKPQEPKDTSSYKAEDITYTNTIDNIKLTGTLTYPKDKKKAPVVILISGSGPQDRNSELLGHKPFLVLADYLTKRGIAVLRVDDRETGTSEGKYNETGLQGFVNDTKFAIDYLKTRKEIDVKKIGLAGHSLGGVVAPIIASQNKDVAFVVLLAAPGMRGDKLMLLQKERIERKMGVDDFGVLVGKKRIGGAYEIIVKAEPNSPTLAGELETYFGTVFAGAMPKSQIKQLAESLAFPWLADFIRYDPAPVLAKVTCPVLALNGENDTQVPAKENLEGIKTALETAGNKNVTIVELPKLNHLFQESETGLPQEYEKIEETFNANAMTVMGDWILKIAK